MKYNRYEGRIKYLNGFILRVRDSKYLSSLVPQCLSAYLAVDLRQISDLCAYYVS